MEKGSHTAAGSLKEEKGDEAAFFIVNPQAQAKDPKQKNSKRQKTKTIKLKNANSKPDENQRRKAIGAKPIRVCQPVAV